MQIGANSRNTNQSLVTKMHKIILTILLAVGCGSASAGWEKVTSLSENGLTVYADPGSISKSDDGVKMLSLYDFKAPQQEEGVEPYLSTKFINEYDCTNRKRRVLEFNNFSKSMGKGDATFSFNDTDIWRPVEPESLSEYLWKYACGKH